MKIKRVYKYILGALSNGTLALTLTEKRDWYQHIDMVEETGLIPFEGGFFHRVAGIKPYRYNFYGESVSAEVATTGNYFNEYFTRVLSTGDVDYYELIGDEHEVPVLIIVPKGDDVTCGLNGTLRKINTETIDSTFGVHFTDNWFENVNIESFK